MDRRRYALDIWRIEKDELKGWQNECCSEGDDPEYGSKLRGGAD